MPPSSILKRLSSLRLPGRSSPVVTPLPEPTPFHQKLTAKMKEGALPESSYSSCSRLAAAALDAAITAQQLAQSSLLESDTILISRLDKEAIDDYLEENVELLDAIRGFLERIETVKKLVDLLRSVVTRLLERGAINHAAVKRAMELLDGRLELSKCKANLRGRCKESKVGEVLSGSRAVATMACRILETALSLKPKRGLKKLKSFGQSTTGWENSLLELWKKAAAEEEEVVHDKGSDRLMRSELREMMKVVERLPDQVKQLDQSGDGGRLLKESVEVVKEKIGRVEEGMERMEGRTERLYKELISFRMTLLGIISHRHCQC